MEDVISGETFWATAADIAVAGYAKIRDVSKGLRF